MDGIFHFACYYVVWFGLVCYLWFVLVLLGGTWKGAGGLLSRMAGLNALGIILTPSDRVGGRSDRGGWGEGGQQLNSARS